MKGSGTERKRPRLRDEVAVWAPEDYVIPGEAGTPGGAKKGSGAPSPHLGKGRTCLVTRANSRMRANRSVAIKQFRRDPGEQQRDYEAHARNEFAILMKLQHHPNIVALVEDKLLIDATSGTLRMVMEVAEWDWRSFMQSRYARQALLRQLKGYARQALLALQYCHDRHIVHRDIKPENIFICANNVVKLGDFGISSARIWDTSKHTDVVTTIWYRAPEVIMCPGLYNYKIDVWSMALTLIELLSLHPLLGRTHDHESAKQLEHIYDVCGTPTVSDWDRSLHQALAATFKWNKPPRVAHVLYRHAEETRRAHYLCPAAVNMLADMLVLLPSKRCTTTDALASPFLAAQPEESAPYEPEQMVHYTRYTF